MNRSPQQLFPAKTIACDFAQFVADYRRSEQHWFRQECERLGGMFSYMPRSHEDLFDLFVLCEDTKRPPFKTYDFIMIYPDREYWYINEDEEIISTTYKHFGHPKGKVQFSCSAEAVKFKETIRK